MKKLTKTFIAIIFLLIVQNGFSQTNEEEQFDLAFEIFSEKHIATYFNNVCLESKFLTIGNAEKIVYDSNQRKLTIYNFEDYNFDGTVNIKNTKSIKTIEYILGEKELIIL